MHHHELAGCLFDLHSHTHLLLPARVKAFAPAQHSESREDLELQRVARPADGVCFP